MNGAAPELTGQARQLDWRQVRVLYVREMRAALREKAIVFNNILIPLFLYPFLMWAAFTGLTFVMGQTEAHISRVAVRGWPAGHPALLLKLHRDDRLQWLEESEEADRPHLPVDEPQTASQLSNELVGETNDAAPTNGRSSSPPLQRLDRRIREGQLDALVEFLPPATNAAALPGNFQVRITYDQSREGSLEARTRVREALSGYREDWLTRQARKRGIGPILWQEFTISSRNLASKRQMGTFILGLVAPILFVVMVAVGCFYPAVDATAGERERNTWETLMSTAATRLSIVTAKYLYVATLGGLAGILNLSAVVLTLRPIFGPLLERAGKTVEVSIPLAALPLTAAAAILLAGFVAAGMMLFAAFARTFKEGQAMITPFYLTLLLPLVFLQAPGLKLSPVLALVPVANLTLLVREALAGVFHPAAIAITLLVSLALIALCIRLAGSILQFEDVVLGDYRGSFAKFIRERLLRRTQSAR